MGCPWSPRHPPLSEPSALPLFHRRYPIHLGNGHAYQVTQKGLPSALYDTSTIGIQSLQAFYNVIQFSCSQPTNQIAVFRRLNWFIVHCKVPSATVVLSSMCLRIY